MTMKACTQFVPNFKQLCFAPKHRARISQSQLEVIQFKEEKH
jgi:hypothetical protein